MKVESHVTIGLFTWGALFFHQPSPLAALPGHGLPLWDTLTIPAVVFGSLLPDLDHPHSAIAHSLVLRPFGWGIRKLTHHRGIMHSLLMAIVVLVAGTLLIDSYLGIALFWGYLSHLFADALTVEGIPLFDPLWNRKLHLPFLAIRTGSAWEGIYLGGIVALAILFAVGQAA